MHETRNRQWLSSFEIDLSTNYVTTKVPPHVQANFGLSWMHIIDWWFSKMQRETHPQYALPRTVEAVIYSAIELKFFQRRKWGQNGNLSKMYFPCFLIWKLWQVATSDQALLIRCSERNTWDKHFEWPCWKSESRKLESRRFRPKLWWYICKWNAFN